MEPQRGYAKNVFYYIVNLLKHVNHLFVYDSKKTFFAYPVRGFVISSIGTQSFMFNGIKCLVL